MAGASEAAPHPYVPTDLKLPDYVPISLPLSTILGGYLLTSLFLVLLVWTLSGMLSLSSLFGFHFSSILFSVLQFLVSVCWR